LSIDQTTQMAMVVATSNSDNSLNQDLNGANGGIGSSLTWGELGVLSDPLTFDASAVPEPAALPWVLIAAARMTVRFRRRRMVR
jgi:hypothetical protein